MTLRRLRLVGAALALSTALVGVPVLALGTPATAAGNNTPTASDVPLSMATFNTAAYQSTKRAMHDINLILARQPDVLTLQEMGSPERRLLVQQTLVDCETCLYDAYMPVPAVPGSTPILYRSDRFALISAQSVQVTNDTYVGKAGAGPSTLRAKFINWVQLRDLLTGRIVNVLNNHAVPSVQGKNGGPNLRAAKRLALYRQHMLGLRELIEQISATTGGLMFVTGDLNVNFRKDKVLKPRVFPYYNLSLEKMKASFELLGMPRTGTHKLKNNDTRLIDYVYVGVRSQLKAVSQEIVMGGYSDHRPLLVKFLVKPGTLPPVIPPTPTPTPEPTPAPTDPATPRS